MNKNTVWAIVLSTIVIFVSYFVLPMIFPSLRPVVNEETAVEVQAEENQVEELELGTTDAAFGESEIVEAKEPEDPVATFY